MKIKLLFISILFIALNNFAQTTCGTIINDTFDDAAALTNWTEYNTSGSVTVTDGKLKFEHSNAKPSVYREFTPVMSNATFSFDVNASRNSVNCQIHLVSSTGKHLTTISVGKGTASIKIATAMENGAPGGFVEGTPQVTLIKDTDYKISTKIDFTTQKVNFYNDGALVYEGAPFLESAEDIAKLDIQLLYMYSNNGQFYFDNITLFTREAHRLLSEEVIIANAMLDAAVVGTAGREYSQNDYDTFQTAINTAIGVEKNCSANQSEVNQALEILKAAMANFKATAVPFQGTISIDVLKTKQKIVMMGGDMERNAPALQQAPNKEEIVDWLVKDIPFNTFRVKYDKLQEMTEGNLDMDGTYADQVLSMKMILKASPNIKFYATMKSDYNGYSQGDRNNLPTFIYDYAYDSATETASGSKSFSAIKYGRFLADYVEYMSNNGVPISYLSTSKEWTQVMTASRAKVTIETLISTLAARNIAMPLIIDPGAWSITQGYNTVNSYVTNNVDQYVYGYSTHNYSEGSKTWSDFATAANNTGKLAVDDESGHGSGGPTNGVYEPEITHALSTYSKKCDMYAGGIQGEVFFELWMNNFTYGRPIMFTSTVEGRRIRSYYLMKKFAVTVVDATYVEQTLNDFEDVTSMAFIKDNKLVIWMVNESELNYAGFSVNVNNLGLKEGMKVQQVYWNPTSVITGAESDIVANTDNQFTANISPQSINCFIIAPNEALSTEKYDAINVKVYPNPVTDKLVISTPDAVFKKYEIYGINGQLVRTGEMSSNEKEVNVSNLAKGIYILKLEGEVVSKIVKIIKN